MSTVEIGTPDSERVTSGSTGRPLPPWLSFSGRWPFVPAPRQSTRWEKGSLPFTPGAVVYQSGSMMPITSYHDARRVSYVEETLSTSPLRTRTRQLGLVNVMATSHDTVPAGS